MIIKLDLINYVLFINYEYLISKLDYDEVKLFLTLIKATKTVDFVLLYHALKNVCSIPRNLTPKL